MLHKYLMQGTTTHYSSAVFLTETGKVAPPCRRRKQRVTDTRGNRCAIQMPAFPASHRCGVGTRPPWTLEVQDEFTLKQVLDVLQQKLIRRGISLKALTYGKIEPAASAHIRQTVDLQQGISTDKAKEIVKAIKDGKLKVQASIQGDSVRVSGKKRDDLQETIAFLKEQDFDLPLQFVNFRD